MLETIRTPSSLIVASCHFCLQRNPAVPMPVVLYSCVTVLAVVVSYPVIAGYFRFMKVRTASVTMVFL